MQYRIIIYYNYMATNMFRKNTHKNILNVNDDILFPVLPVLKKEEKVIEEKVIEEKVIEEKVKTNYSTIASKTSYSLSNNNSNSNSNSNYNSNYNSISNNTSVTNNNCMLMDEVIERLINNWEAYEREYDSINGDGMYAERFRMSPILFKEDDDDTTDEEEDEKKDSDYFSD